MKNIIFLLLILFPFIANSSTWIEVKSKKDSSGNLKKNISLLSGKFPKGKKLSNLHNPILLFRHTEGEIFQREFKNGNISFDMPYKGSYHIFLLDKYIENDILYINLYKTRVYNKNGDIKDAIIKEIRGKTIGSHYSKEPFSKVPFELILQDPIKKHHINCCLYSGDILPIKFFLNQNIQKNISLKVTTQKGWINNIYSDDKDFISFEIPRNTYTDISINKRLKESMLLEATLTKEIDGVFKSKKYSKIIYYSSIPLTFRTSPLEYTSQMAAFYVFIGVMLIFSLGIYYNRRKKKKTPKEIWFDEK